MAALHSNENGKKEQADTKDGRANCDVFFLKVKGGFSDRPVRKDSTYGVLVLLNSDKIQCKVHNTTKNTRNFQPLSILYYYIHWYMIQLSQAIFSSIFRLRTETAAGSSSQM